MTDTVSKQTRSRIMAAVKPRGNLSTELAMSTLLKKWKLKGWRRHYPIRGTPDFTWPKQRIALFVDGCFWHGCVFCKRKAKSNIFFWRSKIVRNRRRDKRVSRNLRNDGWKVLRVWECKIKNETTIKRVLRAYKLRDQSITDV